MVLETGTGAFAGKPLFGFGSDLVVVSLFFGYPPPFYDQSVGINRKTATHGGLHETCRT